MTKPPKAEAAEPASDLHEIELDGITRDYDIGFETDIYTVDFETTGTEGNTKASVEVVSGEATTTEIIPTAMGRLHTLFSVLARQTEGWRKEKP